MLSIPFLSFNSFFNVFTYVSDILSTEELLFLAIPITAQASEKPSLFFNIYSNVSFNTFSIFAVSAFA